MASDCKLCRDPEDRAGDVAAAPAGSMADLLTALYRGPLEPRPFTEFLERFRSFVEADYVSLGFRPLDASMAQAVSLFSSDRPMPQAELGLIAELHRRSPLPYDSMAVGAVSDLHELLDSADPAHRAFVREYLAPRGLDHLLILRVREPGGSNAWLAMARRENDFDEDARAKLAALEPHLTTAMQYLAELERERRRGTISTDAIRRLDYAWITFDRAGEPIEYDARAGEILTAAGILNRSGKVMRLQPLVGDDDLRTALQSVIDSHPPRQRAVRLSSEPPLDMLLVPLREEALSGPRTAVAVGYFHGDMHTGTNQRELLSELFRLTSSEADLALALCRGRSIAEAAHLQGLTLETARTYSKRIYFKTGAKGQADLVRLILRSVIALV